MKKFGKIIQELNSQLYAKEFDRDAFCWQIGVIRELSNREIAIFDFVLHNEEMMKTARIRKIEALSVHQYKEAAYMRDLEVCCERYLSYRKQYPYEKSLFDMIGSQLAYLHFGNAPNDKQVMEVLKDEKN